MNSRHTNERRKRRTRARLQGTADRPRCSVFRSRRHIAAQLIDDGARRTLLALSDIHLPKATRAKKKPLEVAALVGETLAGKAASQGITAVVFDRGSFRYHGRVKALADGARKGGLRF